MKSSLIQIFLTLALLPVATGCKSKSASSSTGSPQPKAEASQPISEEAEFKPEILFKSAEGLNLVKEFRLAQSELLIAKDRLLLFARCGDPTGKGPESLQRVKDPESWPENRLVMYVFLLDPSGRIRLMQIVPNSESGDWYEQNDYLVGPDGSLNYWERYYGSFNPDEPQKSWYAYSWSKSGVVLDQASKFVDPDGHVWKGAKPKRPSLPPLHLKSLLDRHKLTEALNDAKVQFAPEKPLPVSPNA